LSHFGGRGLSWQSDASAIVSLVMFQGNFERIAFSLSRFHHCVTVGDDFGFVTEGFVKPQRREGNSLMGILTTRRRHSSQSCLEKQLD